MDRSLLIAGLALGVAHAATLGGMGRPGGEFFMTAYTFLLLFAWPVAFFRSSEALRVLGYVTAPLLYAGVAFWTPHSVWEALGLGGVWFNYFGEVEIFKQALKGLLFTALTVTILETIRHRRARAPRPEPSVAR